MQIPWTTAKKKINNNLFCVFSSFSVVSILCAAIFISVLQSCECGELDGKKIIIIIIIFMTWAVKKRLCLCSGMAWLGKMVATCSWSFMGLGIGLVVACEYAFMVCNAMTCRALFSTSHFSKSNGDVHVNWLWGDMASDYIILLFFCPLFLTLSSILWTA